MILMWKVKFYPIWKLSEIEGWLAQMESRGLRLTKVNCRYFFHFVPSKQKEVQYTVLYSFLKEHSMVKVRTLLQSRYNADSIGDPYGILSVYRICDMSFYKELIEHTRLRYIKHVIIQKLLMCLMMNLPLFVCTILDSFLSVGREADYLYAIIASLICLFLEVYYLFGLGQVMKDIRKINKIWNHYC